MSTFYIDGVSGDSKRLFVACADSEDLQITIDTDDVDSMEVGYCLKRMLTCLNDHWEEYGHIVAPETPNAESDDENDRLWEERWEKANDLLWSELPKEFAR